jgi:hypothetical protein
LSRWRKRRGAELDVDAAGGVGEDIAADAGERHFEQHDDQQADGDHIERGHAAMDQYLVHHHLEKQRRDQGEELQDEGNQQHFAEQLAIFDYRGDEPAEVELRQIAGERGARGKQDQLAAPARFEVGK